MAVPIGFWFRAALWILPAHLREEHEREIADCLQLSARGAAGPLASFRLWAWVAFDALRAAPKAHWDVLRQDLDLALRQLTRAPIFAITAILILGIGIGGNATLFALCDSVLLRPLPYRDGNRLVDLTENQPERGWMGFGISPANFRDLTAVPGVFQSAAAYQLRSGTAKLDETPQRVRFAAVSGDFFRVLTDPAALGRTLTPEEDVPGATVAVVSHQFWTNSLGADPRAVGRGVDLDGTRYRIVGVMPPAFDFPAPSVAMWIGLGVDPAEWQSTRGARYLQAVGRLAPGVDVARADGAVATRAKALAAAFPANNQGWTASVQDLRAAGVSSAREPLLLAVAAGVLVLLIALANVANLLLGRALAREREMALRSALGARAGRLVRQLATEGLLLAALGTVLGLGLTAILLGPVTALAAPALPRLEGVAFGGRVVIYTVGLMLVTTVAFSILPALQGRGLRPWRILGSGRSAPGRERTRWQTILVVGEVGLAVLVLVGGALVARTIVRLLDRPLGFDPNGVLTFRIEPPIRASLNGPRGAVSAAIDADRVRAVEGFRLLADRLRALPGVTAVGAVNRLPLTGEWWVTSVDLASRPAASEDQRIAPYVRVVTPGYFEAMGSRILRGRGIQETDRLGVERAVVIDETFARQVFGTVDPLGQELLLGGPPDHPAPRGRIVGVVESARMGGLDAPARPTFYISFGQATEGHGLNWGMDVVLRHADPAAVRARIVEAAKAVFPDAAVFRLTTLDGLIDTSLAPRRFQLILLGLFGAVAIALTMIGIAGLLLLVVSQRRREFAVRLALGAGPREIWWRVQGHAMMLAGIGAGAGLAVAVLAARLFQSLVADLSVRDPVALAAGPLLAVVAAFLAALVPATRAVKADPARILREE